MKKTIKTLIYAMLGVAMLGLASCEPIDGHQPYYGEEVVTFREDAYYTQEVWAQTLSSKNYVEHYLIFGLGAEYREDEEKYLRTFLYIEFDGDDYRNPQFRIEELLYIDDALSVVNRRGFEPVLYPSVDEDGYKVWSSYSSNKRDVLYISWNESYIRPNYHEYWGNIKYKIDGYSIWVYQEGDEFAWYVDLLPQTRGANGSINPIKMPIKEAIALGIFKDDGKIKINTSFRK